MKKNLNINSKIFLAGHKGLVGSSIYKKLKNLAIKKYLLKLEKN